MALFAYIELVTILGSRFLYPAQFSTGVIKLVIAMFTKFGTLSFVSFLPLLWVTVQQRKLFYPSALAALGFSAILLGRFNISTEMLPLASLMPWTAVSLVSVYQVEGPYTAIGMVSIALTGIFGVQSALRAIDKQDL